MTELIYRNRRFPTKDGAYITMSCLLTGSAVYGQGFPGDIDYLTEYNETRVKALLDAGWLDSTEAFPDYPTDAFCSLRNGVVNLIFWKTPFFKETFEKGHQFLLEYPEWGVEKADRIAVFEHFRGTGTDWKLVAFIKLQAELEAKALRKDEDYLPF